MQVVLKPGFHTVSYEHDTLNPISTGEGCFPPRLLVFSCDILPNLRGGGRGNLPRFRVGMCPD